MGLPPAPQCRAQVCDVKCLGNQAERKGRGLARRRRMRPVAACRRGIRRERARRCPARVCQTGRRPQESAPGMHPTRGSGAASRLLPPSWRLGWRRSGAGADGRTRLSGALTVETRTQVAAARWPRAGPAGVCFRTETIADQSGGGATTSRAGGNATGHMGGAVSVCSPAGREVERGSAPRAVSRADVACGGGRWLDCSSAESEPRRRRSGGASKRGVSTRDAGALHRPTSAMNWVRRPPKRSRGSKGSCRGTTASAAVVPT